MARNKFGNKKTAVDDITFDSQAEAKYYQQLKWLKQSGQIKSFKLQPKFMLQEAFKKNGKSFRKIEYKADFEVHRLDDSVEIVDIKGAVTKEFSLKRKLFERKYLNSITLLKYDKKKGFVEMK
ncbi:DUF1064 domain-containing protein [Bacillus sp. ISL-75]|nr:DUF1064 domain-containing protein [Bacillus sp. ISL-75]